MHAQFVIKLFLAILALIGGKLAVTQEKCCYTLRGSIAFKDSTLPSSIILSLYKTADSSRLLSTVTDSVGAFHFQGIPAGEYLMGLDVLKNKTRLLPHKYLVTQSIDNIRIELGQQVQSLQEVLVVSKKPFLQRESDRLVINLENSTLTRGNSLLEAFRKLPGLDVLQGNTITVNGQSDVFIIIDGKGYRSSSAQAIQMLNSLRSENVEKLEIFTTPPARYEAEGSSIINVVLKKDKIFSSLSFSFGQRLYPVNDRFGGGLNQLAGSGNFFYSLGKLRFNTRIGISDNGTSYTKQSYVTLFEDGQRNNSSLTTSDASNFFLNTNVNYAIKSHTFSLGLSANNNLSTNIHSLNEDVFLKPTKEIDSAFKSRINTKISSSNPVLILAYDYLINKNKSQSILLSAIWGSYKNEYDIDQDITPYSGDASFFSQFQDYSVKSRAIKMDYTQTSKVLGKIETGLKHTRLRNNDAYSYSSLPANNFSFDESINALYLSMSKSFKNKISYTAGVRAEQTINKGVSSLLPGKSIEKNYIDLFPNFSFQYTLDKTSRLGLAYSRRIARLSYNNFNPANYVLFNDAFSNQQGNTDLKPQYLSKYDLSFQKNKFYSALTYTHKANVRTMIAETSGNRFISYTIINLTGHDLNLLAAYNHKFSKRFEANLNASAQYYSYKLINQSTAKSLAVRVSASQAFMISETSSADLSIRYYSPFRMEYWSTGGYYTVDAGIRKSLFKKNLTVSLSINDLTGSNKVIWKYFYPDFEKKVQPLSNERLFTLSVSFRFKSANRFQLKRAQGDEFGETRYYK